ncbi:MAG: DUF3467 domain-containing protein [Bacteroidaceae bacterium]|nr:DUF3467 domain-containing protein [Bacteroidaceae bacterium]
MEKENQKQLQVELKPEVAQGVYSNFAIIANTANEFVADFVSLLPGMPKATVQSRVIMTPENAKRLLFALQERVRGYEQQFGTIELQQQPPKGSTIAPFGMPKGEA